MYSKDWVVYCNPPFKDASSIIEYLGKYTHRIAISNNRILNIDDGKGTFKWRDYRDKNKMKTMVLNADEFIRRFVLHILPPRFMKIRHFGLLGNRNKTKKFNNLIPTQNCLFIGEKYFRTIYLLTQHLIDYYTIHMYLILQVIHIGSKIY